MKSVFTGKSFFLVFFVSAFFLTSSLVHAGVESVNSPGDTLNLATKAKITTSFVSGWEELAALNDGVSSTSSMSKPSAGAYGNWNGDADYGKYNWVMYEWDKANKILSTEVYWWIDNTVVPAAGISKPTDAYIEYWNGVSWVRFGNIGLDLNKFNKLNLGVVTNKLKLTMKSGAATGIIEWKATGVESGNCSETVLEQYTKVLNGEIQKINIASVSTGDSVIFSSQDIAGGFYAWSGPGGFTSTQKSLVLKNLQPSQSGSYKLVYTNECFSLSSCYFHLTVKDSSLSNSASIVWPKYNPTLNYNFRDEFPSLSMPTKILGDCPEAVGTISSGWWAFKWGAKANTLIDSASVMPMLKRLNDDFAYFRDTLGWPPDKRAKRGFKSTVFLFGSGLSTDKASNTDLGGWQSATSFNNESWPMVLLSYYPIYSFNPKATYGDKIGQQGAVVHEGIHSVLADLPGCKNAAWFHEGGNTWLQQEAEVRKSNNYNGMGFLNVGSFIAPFMPIECYSGWLQDGSFGGPSAEGVNMFNGSTQICTWRNLLGGVQYSNIFPVFLGMTLGHGSIAWIWRNCESRVLEGMAKTLGETQIRRLISEYRAKQAVLDMGKWTTNMKSLLNGSMGSSIKAEWSPYWINVPAWTATPYVKTTNNGTGLLTPDAKTLPGWSGANQIPLLVTGNEVIVDFKPIGRNMTCQLCYRTKDGKIVYSQIVNGGNCSLNLNLKPANNCVFAVITNTDYIYEGDTTRKSHFDYRLQLVKGVTYTADINKRWYDWNLTLVDLEEAKIEDRVGELSVYPNPLTRGGVLNVSLGGDIVKNEVVEIRNLSGQLIYRSMVSGDFTISSLSNIESGVYMVSAGGRNAKLIVK